MAWRQHGIGYPLSMSTTTNRNAALRLIETATLVDFEVANRSVQPTVDGEDCVTRMSLQLGGEVSEGDEQVEWGAFGFLFTLAALSFADARPRGISDMDFLEADEFTVADFLEGLRFVGGELHLDLDYLRGRC